MRKNTVITEKTIQSFVKRLREDEKSEATIDKYTSILRRFAVWLNGAEITKPRLLEYRTYLQEKMDYSPETVNVHLSAIHSYLDRNGLGDCKVKRLKIQTQVFRPEERELTEEEYRRLVHTAARLGLNRLSLMIQTICSTGIRVSELVYVTVEAAKSSRAEISLKGKIRVILLPEKLCSLLREYAEQEQITSGPVFLTTSGTPMTRQQVWSEMKALCQEADVNPTKVFPHNLRHLFARCFYEETKDIVKLADVLGHSSVDTTRVYLISSGSEHAEVMNRLNLIG